MLNGNLLAIIFLIIFITFCIRNNKPQPEKHTDETSGIPLIGEVNGGYDFSSLVDSEAFVGKNYRASVPVHGNIIYRGHISAPYHKVAGGRHANTTLKRSDLPERTDDISELAQIFYVSVRDALPTEDNPMPDLEKLEDVLSWKEVVKARHGTPGLEMLWGRSASDVGSQVRYGGEKGYNGLAGWVESVTGRLVPMNHFRYWMHGNWSRGGCYQPSTTVVTYNPHPCDTNIDVQIRDESRDRKTAREWVEEGATYTSEANGGWAHPDGKSIGLMIYNGSNMHHYLNHSSKLIRFGHFGADATLGNSGWPDNNTRKYNQYAGHHEKGNCDYSMSSIHDKTLACVTANGADVNSYILTNTGAGWDSPWVYDGEYEKIFEGAQHMHNGGRLGGTGIGYDGVERYSEYGFIVDARITLMRLVNAKKDALNDIDGFISRLDAIMEPDENNLDIGAAIDISQEAAFSLLPTEMPQYAQKIADYKRTIDKIKVKVRILEKNVKDNLKTDSNPNPDINDLRDAIDEIKSSESNIIDYFLQFLADAENNYKLLEEEYEEIYRYSNNLKSRIIAALPSEDRPYPDIEPLEDILDVAFRSEDSKRICRSELSGCRRFLGETFSYEAELDLQWLKNQKEERAGERELAKERAEESIIEYENLLDFTCVSVPDPIPDGFIIDVDEDGIPEPTSELYHDPSCDDNEMAIRTTSYGRQQLAYSRMMMFNVINLAYEQEAAGIITAGQLDIQKDKAIEESLIGIQGLRGPIGPKGDEGASGSDGATGPRGSQGLQGLMGPEGASGSDGQQGPEGAAGSDGATGPRGSQGLQGLTGPEGAAGSDGATGPRGSQGLQGLMGPEGVSGSDGATGPRGSQGLQGLMGPEGVSGSDGAQGPEGAAGSDGATGPRGSRGLQGLLGPEGASGSDGAQGPEGAAGSDGATGPRGSQGLQGLMGPLGESGRDGSLGPKGPRGSRGLQGLLGPLGESGRDGGLGPRGSRGLKGPRGSRGLKGNAGVDGQMGLQGLQGPSNMAADEKNMVIGSDGYLRSSTVNRVGKLINSDTTKEEPQETQEPQETSWSFINSEQRRKGTYTSGGSRKIPRYNNPIIEKTVINNSKKQNKKGSYV